jgi:hypothetical protein
MRRLRPRFLSAFRLAPGELRWPAAFAACFMLATLLPYLYGWIVTPAGFHYSGLLTNADEHNVYLSWMEQARRGQLLFLDKFTTEPQPAAFFHLFFLLLGWAARLTRLPNVLIYHAARLVSGFLLLLAVYLLAAHFSGPRRPRRAALAFAAIGSGLGWLFYPRLHSIELGPGLFMPEAITFLSLLLNPLFCISVFLFILTLLFLLLSHERRSWRFALASGAAGLLLGNIHSYDLIPLLAVVAVYLAVLWLGERRLPGCELKLTVLALLLMSPSVLYQVFLYRINPVFRARADFPTLSSQLSPSPLLSYLLGFGLPLVLAVLGASLLLRERPRPRRSFLLIWLIVGFIALWAPLPFQRKLAEGLHIPIVVLAALGAAGLCEQRRWPGLALAALVLLTSPSSLLFGVGRSLALTQSPASHFPPLYLHRDHLKAFRWLKENTDPNERLLCNPLLGSYAPQLSGNTVYLGHWAETVEFNAKYQRFRAFLRATSGEEMRLRLMREAGLNYYLEDDVFDETRLWPEVGPRFRADRSPLFRLERRFPNAAIYRFLGSR